MKQLIINADDFGLSRGITQGIITAHRQGVLTSTSLMANGKTFDFAVELAGQNPSLAVGVHLVLVEEQPVSPVGQVKSLVDENGFFMANYRQVLTRWLLGLIRPQEVEREWRAQIEKIRAAEIHISHLDSHQHLHVFPGLLSIAIRLATEYQIPWMRHAYDFFSPSGLGQRGLKILAGKAKKHIKKSGIQSPDYFFGASLSGRLDKSSLMAILRQIPPGVSEIMCHPGDYSPNQAGDYTHWQFNWLVEQQALLSHDVKSLIEQNDIELTNPGKCATSPTIHENDHTVKS